MPTHERAAEPSAPVRAPQGQTSKVRRMCDACDDEGVRRSARPDAVTDPPRLPLDFSFARIPVYSPDEVARRAAEPAAPVGLGGGPLPDGLGAYLARSVGSGRALDAPARARLESSFGRSLAGVRVIADEDAARAAEALHARAFTVGQSIWFGRSEYRPGTRDGDHLLAHEIAHTVQAVAAVQADLVVGSAGDPTEAEADRAADAAVRGDVVEVSSVPTGPRVTRQPKPGAGPDAAVVASEKEIAQAMQSARAIQKQADAMVVGATKVDLDLVDIVQMQGEAVEDTLTRVADSSRAIAALPRNSAASSSAQPPSSSRCTSATRSTSASSTRTSRSSSRTTSPTQPTWRTSWPASRRGTRSGSSRTPMSVSWPATWPRSAPARSTRSR